MLSLIVLGGILFTQAGCMEPGPLESDDLLTDEAPESGQTIANRYIVRVAGDSGDRRHEALQQVLSDHGISARFEFTHTFSGFAAILKPEQQVSLATDERVLSIEADRTVGVTSACPANACFEEAPLYGAGQTVPWNVSYVGGPFTGTGRRAWIIDGGIDASHPDLAVDVSLGESFLFDRRGEPFVDATGRGTFLAGAVAARDNDIGIVGVAPGTMAVPLQVLDRSGAGSVSGLIAALDYAAVEARASDAAILGFQAPQSNLLKLAMVALADLGIRVVLPAGDSGRLIAPESALQVDHPNVYTVTAVDSKDFLARFGNYGSPPVDFAAPGVETLSTGVGATYVKAGGTAVAAAHLAGLLLTGNVSPKTVALGIPSGDTILIARR